MLNRIRRWLFGSVPSPASQSVKAWAQGRGYQYKAGDEPWGFSVEGRLGPRSWRMEYGRPQRSYIERAELRLRLDLNLPPTLNLMLLSRHLIDPLEKAAFERLSAGRGSKLERSSNEEMRWLALYPKVSLHAISGLRKHFDMVGSSPEAAQHWLHGALGERLAAYPESRLAGLPLVLMTVRGRLYLRLELHELTVPPVEDALALFLDAAERAQEVLSHWVEENDGTWLSTTSIAWQSGELHVELPLDLPPTPKS